MNYRAQTVALLFEQMADLMEIGDIEPYKAAAYRRGARSIRAADDRLDELLARDRVQELDGIGPALADKAREIVETGRCEAFERLSERVPRSLLELLRVNGLGTKTAATLYRQLHITSLSELEEAAREKRLRRLPGIGARREQKILANIMREHKRGRGVTLDWADAVARELVRRLQSSPPVTRVLPVGALRRRRALIESVALLVEVNREAGDFAVQAEELTGVARMPIRSRRDGRYPCWEFELEIGLPGRIYAVDAPEAGLARVHLTGSGGHLQRLREWGLDDLPPAPAEDAVYGGLGMSPVPPELREGLDEVQLARAGKLPELVRRRHLRGDLHCHSDWSDGTASIRDMVEGARRCGLHYLAITDHSCSLQVAGGLDVSDLRRQGEEIVALRDEYPDFTILRGVEVDILSDGSLDLPDEILDELDVVVASLHSGLRRSAERLTARLTAAARHPAVDILGHPTARLIGVRETDTPDLESVLQVCAETGTMVEINAHPDRLDLPWRWVRRAREIGVGVAVNSDAHSPDGFSLLQYGIDCARKGGCVREDIVNAAPVRRLKEQFHFASSER